MQHQFKSKDIKIGDIIYKKLRWPNEHCRYARHDNPATGCAIERDGVVIHFSMPVIAKAIEETRKVLFEKALKY